jgi:hypothetical protein
VIWTIAAGVAFFGPILTLAAFHRRPAALLLFIVPTAIGGAWLALVHRPAVLRSTKVRDSVPLLATEGDHSTTLRRLLPGRGVALFLIGPRANLAMAEALAFRHEDGELRVLRRPVEHPDGILVADLAWFDDDASRIAYTVAPGLRADGLMLESRIDPVSLKHLHLEAAFSLIGGIGGVAWSALWLAIWAGLRRRRAYSAPRDL